MPKIIENVKEMLLAEARRQIEENGYSAVTVRSVAGACGLGIGTVYNYFPSKDMLIASFMAEDWQICLKQLKDLITASSEPNAALRCIYDTLKAFTSSHEALFADPQAVKVFRSVFAERHKMLRDQIAGLLLPICSPRATEATTVAPGESPTFTAQFIAEALLTWTAAGTSFEELSPMLNRLL